MDGKDYSSLHKIREHAVIGELAQMLQKAEEQALAGMSLLDLVVQIENTENQDVESVAEGAAG
jgi:hypothetical protein